MAEKQKLSGIKNNAAKLHVKSVQSMNESAAILTENDEASGINSSKINSLATTADDSSIHVDNSAKPSTSSETSQTQENTCENCKDCICRSWRSNLTPEFSALFELQADSIRKYVSAKVSNASKKLKIEVHPNTGIFLSENELNLAFSKANYRHREMVRQLLSLIVTNEDLIAFKTAENMNRNKPNIRTAIIGYLKSECGVSLTIVEFNDIVRRKIDQAVMSQKPPEEIQKIKNKSIERALNSRSKRKLLSKGDSSVLSKKKKNSEDTSVMTRLCNSKSQDEDNVSQNKTDLMINEDSPLMNKNDYVEQLTVTYTVDDDNATLVRER